MIIETTINLKNKNKEELILLLNESLKVIQKQQAELENKDKQIEQYQNMLATNDMLHVKECEKKDKIIDEQIDYIYSFLHGHLDYISNDIAGNKKKLKQYFERKVEEDKDE